MITPTLRDHFAMAALTGILAGRSSIIYVEDSAKKAYEIADAMIAERRTGVDVPPDIPTPPIKW